MASITYNTGRANITHVFRATDGGVTFSANLVGTAFDYFLDSPTVDDAIYFTISGYSYWAGLEIDVATAMVGTDIVLIWEYHATWIGDVWKEIPRLTDNTNSLTTTGADVLVDFPKPPANFNKAVNGISSYCHIRCRLVSFTSVTEGGANTDDTPQYGDGKILINDYTEESPCTLDEIYDYMNTNYPECGMVKLGVEEKREFHIPHAMLNGGNGYWKMANNVLKVGNGGANYKLDIRYLTDGIKIGDDKFTSSSTIIYCSYTGSTFITSAATTKLYGTTFSPGIYTETIGGTTYTTPAWHANYTYVGLTYGEYIGVRVLNMQGGYWYGAPTLKNVFLYSRAIVLYPFGAGTIFENVHLYYVARNGLLMLYSGGGTGEMENLSWYIPSGALFQATALGAGTYTYNFLNPSPAFPDIGDSPDYMASNATYDVKDWHIYERYTLDLKAVDATGEGIVDATVTITDKNGDAVTGSPFTTDASGDITQAKCIKSHGYWDTERKKDEYNPYTVTITKAGYKPRSIKYTMDRKREEIEKLSPDGTSLQDVTIYGSTIY